MWVEAKSVHLLIFEFKTRSIGLYPQDKGRVMATSLEEFTTEKVEAIKKRVTEVFEQKAERNLDGFARVENHVEELVKILKEEFNTEFVSFPDSVYVYIDGRVDQKVGCYHW
jgi:hypothetical protein